MATLTSANSVFMLGVDNLYNIPVQIQGYATDDAFSVADVDMGEAVMGIDYHLSAGFIPYPVPLEITLQADSASNSVFDAIISAEAIAREKYVLNGSILIPAISQVFTFTRGFLTKGTLIPPGKKILQPRKFELTFERVTGVPV